MAVVGGLGTTWRGWKGREMCDDKVQPTAIIVHEEGSVPMTSVSINPALFRWEMLFVNVAHCGLPFLILPSF